MKNYLLHFLLCKVHLFIIFLCVISCNACYLNDGTPETCLPSIKNVAFGRTVNASDTCGTPAEEHCLPTADFGATRSCHICNSSAPSQSHDASYLTDSDNFGVSTWWQSSSMLHDVQYPNMVNLTLDFNETFDITYIRITFTTSRPESFAIYKKRCEECDWQPFQYYSASCLSTYGVGKNEMATSMNVDKALCTDEYSNVAPLSGGIVSFSSLVGRPGACNFDKSKRLQDWVKASAIRITLNRMNTFGDEVFGDTFVLTSYYYGISNLAVVGRCSCNGHASECFVDSDNVLKCRCQHNTTGKNCERCSDLYNDRPWMRGSSSNPGECKACDCNGFSERCYFDMELYRLTGSGGHCSNCRENRDGPNCDFCKPNYFNSSGVCEECGCNSIGSLSRQCDNDGHCNCKPGIGGDGCDRCLEDHTGIDELSCRLRLLVQTYAEATSSIFEQLSMNSTPNSENRQNN